jgi:hypothetical protein
MSMIVAPGLLGLGLELLGRRNGDDGAVGVVQDGVSDRAGAVDAVPAWVPADDHQVGAGRQAG